jgi:hypothetical protein
LALNFWIFLMSLRGILYFKSDIMIMVFTLQIVYLAASFQDVALASHKNFLLYLFLGAFLLLNEKESVDKALQAS